MLLIKHLTTWLLLLTVITASGIVSAKVASGSQNLSGSLHQAETGFNSLIRQAKIDFSYDAASGFPLATKSAGKEPNRIYSARELKRRAENPRTNNAANPNHNFPESFNAEIFKGNKTIVSDKYHLYTKPGTLNGRSGVYEIGVKPSASGKTEVITHRFFNPSKK